MSRMMSKHEYDDGGFELGDMVSFLHDGERLVGEVVRVYSDRLNYHVEVDGRRYEACMPDDDIRRV